MIVTPGRKNKVSPSLVNVMPFKPPVLLFLFPSVCSHTFPPLPALALALYLWLFTLLSHTDTKPLFPRSLAHTVALSEPQSSKLCAGQHSLHGCSSAGCCLIEGAMGVKRKGRRAVQDLEDADKSGSSTSSTSSLRFQARLTAPQLISFTSKWPSS